MLTITKQKLMAINLTDSVSDYHQSQSTTYCTVQYHICTALWYCKTVLLAPHHSFIFHIHIDVFIDSIKIISSSSHHRLTKNQLFVLASLHIKSSFTETESTTDRLLQYHFSLGSPNKHSHRNIQNIYSRTDGIHNQYYR